MCRHTRKYFFVLFVTKNKLFVLIVIGKTRYLIDYLRNLHLDYDCKRNLEMQETGNTADNLCIFLLHLGQAHQVLKKLSNGSTEAYKYHCQKS